MRIKEECKWQVENNSHALLPIQAHSSLMQSLHSTLSVLCDWLSSVAQAIRLLEGGTEMISGTHSARCPTQVCVVKLCVCLGVCAVFYHVTYAIRPFSGIFI